MNTLQIHLDQFRHTPGNTKKEASFMEQKLKQDIQIGETIRSLRMERKLTQDQVVSKLQLMDLDITRSWIWISPGASTLRLKAVHTVSVSPSLRAWPRSFR